LEFSNEALYSKLVSSKAAQRRLRRRFVAERGSLEFISAFHGELKAARDGQQALSTLVESLSRILDSEVLFFRHIPVQNHFICTHACRNIGLKGLQLDLPLESLEADPESARDVLTALLNESRFDARALSPSGKALGLLVLGRPLADPALRRCVDQAVQFFELHYELFEARKILYENLIKDEVTGAWTKA
jgi:hypothetical protein